MCFSNVYDFFLHKTQIQYIVFNHFHLYLCGVMDCVLDCACSVHLVMNNYFEFHSQLCPLKLSKRRRTFYLPSSFIWVSISSKNFSKVTMVIRAFLLLVLNIPKFSAIHAFLQAKALGILDLITNGPNLMLPSIIAIRATSFLSLSFLPPLSPPLSPCVVSVLFGSFALAHSQPLSAFTHYKILI